MAKDKERVTLIRYVFSANDHLFASVDDLSRYEVELTIEKYIGMCAKELQRVYSKAAIEVINSDSAMTASETHVESWDDFEEFVDIDEIDRVNEICNRIHNQRAWYKLKEYIPISEMKTHSQIPLPVIRWLCVNGLVEESVNSLGHWELLFEQITRIRELVTLLSGPELVGIVSESAIVACYIEDSSDVSIITFPEHFKLLVAAKDGFHNTFFESETSLFLIYREGSQIQITVEHFVDTLARWSSSWTYPTFVEALSKQAKRKGIKYRFQETSLKGRNEIVGVSFFLSSDISHGMTLKTLITDSLSPLLEIIRDTELSLKGVPLWDKSYEKKGGEIRFHTEILYHLLHKMHYPIVLYTHASRGEHGRDFVFADATRFGDLMYYGLQVKAGDVSGGANKDIENLIIQIERAFMMPVITTPEKPEVYISTMIIVITGKFKKDAIEVMRKALSSRIVGIGCVCFWDREKIDSLISQYWKKENI